MAKAPSTTTTGRNAPKPDDRPTREERTRREILDATHALVERHGFAKVTLEDIAGALGKKKSFLYYYYPDKEAILSAMVEKESAEIDASIRTVLEHEASGKDKIGRYLLQCHQEIKKRLPLISHLRKEIQAKEHGSFAILLDQSRKFLHKDIPMLEDLLREGVRDESLRKLSGAEIEAIANFTAMALHGIEYNYVMGGADDRVDEYLNVAIRTLERGIAV
jgi:AcrR family transcriptional regulator